MPEARRPANSSGRSLREIDNLVTGVMMGVELPLTVRILGLGGPDPVAMSVPGPRAGLAGTGTASPRTLGAGGDRQIAETEGPRKVADSRSGKGHTYSLHG